MISPSWLLYINRSWKCTKTASRQIIDCGIKSLDDVTISSAVFFFLFFFFPVGVWPLRHFGWRWFNPVFSPWPSDWFNRLAARKLLHHESQLKPNVMGALWYHAKTGSRRRYIIYNAGEWCRRWESLLIIFIMARLSCATAARIYASSNLTKPLKAREL